MRIGIIAALPGELKQLVNTGWKPSAAAHKGIRKWTTAFGDSVCIAVCAGMGAEAARRAFIEAESGGALDIVLSVGWAGALTPELATGSTYVASEVIDAQTGERFDLAGGARHLIVVSTARVAQETEKRRLASSYGAAMVDMESAAVVRLAEMRNIPALCFKAISDSVDLPLPDMNPFITSDGTMRMAAFLGHVVLRPGLWPSLVRLGRGSSAASASLASAIVTFLTGPRNVAETNRTGNVDW